MAGETKQEFRLPWRADGPIVRNELDRTVGRVHDASWEYADPSRIAQLWAASPALYEALKGLHACASEADRRVAWESVGLGNDFADRMEGAIREARAALSSASPTSLKD